MTSVLHEIARLRRELRALRPEAVEALAAEAVGRLEALQAHHDPEVAHEAADRVLCRFLRAIGHRAVADEFEAVERWYG